MLIHFGVLDWSMNWFICLFFTDYLPFFKLFLKPKYIIVLYEFFIDNNNFLQGDLLFNLFKGAGEVELYLWHEYLHITENNEADWNPNPGLRFLILYISHHPHIKACPINSYILGYLLLFFCDRRRTSVSTGYGRIFALTFEAFFLFEAFLSYIRHFIF